MSPEFAESRGIGGVKTPRTAMEYAENTRLDQTPELVAQVMRLKTLVSNLTELRTGLYDHCCKLGGEEPKKAESRAATPSARFGGVLGELHYNLDAFQDRLDDMARTLRKLGEAV